MVGQSHHPKSQRSRGPPQSHGSMMAWKWGELNRPMQRPKTNWFPFKFTEKKISLNFFPVDFYFTCPRIHVHSSFEHWISWWRTWNMCQVESLQFLAHFEKKWQCYQCCQHWPLTMLAPLHSVRCLLVWKYYKVIVMLVLLFLSITPKDEAYEWRWRGPC